MRLTSSAWARRAARFLTPAAPVLLLFPAVFLSIEMTHWDWRPWLDGQHVRHYQMPRVAIAVLAAVAAALFPLRRHRRFATGLGIAAVLAAFTVPLAYARSDHLWWTCFGAFGDHSEHGARNFAWSAATLAVLLCVPRTPGSAARRHVQGRVLGVARFVPGWLGVASAVAFLHLAYGKIHSLVPVKCPDPWLDANLLMTSAELWTGVLILLPATRREGLRFGMLVMEATAVYAARQWVGGASSRGCGCFGGIEAPWWAHAVIAGGLAIVLGAARARELKLHAASRCARAAHSRSRSRFPAVLVWGRAFRRAHHANPAETRWIAPSAGVVLGFIAVPVLGNAFDRFVAELGRASGPDAGRLAFLVAWGVAPLAAAWHLLRPDLRAAGIDPLVASVFSAPRRCRATASALRQRANLALDAARRRLQSAVRAPAPESNRGLGTGPRPR